MLAEALRSIVGADEICILDDGSSFNVRDIVASSGIVCPSIRTTVAGVLRPEERVVTARFGRNANKAIREVCGDVIAYLCDDDLFHPGWIQAIKEAWATEPTRHWAKGEWGIFEDGTLPCEISQCPCPLDERHRMTTGNFAYKKTCPETCGLWWNEEKVAVHDNFLINDALPQAHSYESIPTIGLAGWRREHRYNMLKYVHGENYTKTALAILKREHLE
jgi:glycosyltransferase involved in cell wall biosynthesis